MEASPGLMALGSCCTTLSARVTAESHVRATRAGDLGVKSSIGMSRWSAGGCREVLDGQTSAAVCRERIVSYREIGVESCILSKSRPFPTSSLALLHLHRPLDPS